MPCKNAREYAKYSLRFCLIRRKISWRIWRTSFVRCCHKKGSAVSAVVKALPVAPGRARTGPVQRFPAFFTDDTAGSSAPTAPASPLRQKTPCLPKTREKYRYSLRFRSYPAFFPVRRCVRHEPALPYCSLGTSVLSASYTTGPASGCSPSAPASASSSASPSAVSVALTAALAIRSSARSSMAA